MADVAARISPADTGDETYEFGPFRLDALRRRLSRDGTTVALSSRAFDTLLALVRRPGRVVEKDELMRLVWPRTFVVDDNLTQQISALRKALGDHSDEPTYVLTVPRRGYCFLAEVVTAVSDDAQPAAAAPAAAAQAPPRGPRLARNWLIGRWALGALAVLVALLVTATVIVGLTRKPASTPASAVRFFETTPDGVSIASGAVISPDGHRLVYVGADSSGQRMLMLRSLDEVEAKPVSGTDGASTPFWSPDSQYIGFFGDNALKKVRLSGDAPSVQTVVAAFPTRGGGRAGGTWSQDGVIVYAPSRLTELYSVSAEGGSPQPITGLSSEGQETAHLWPQFLPDGRHFLYTAVGRRPEDGGIYLASLESRTRTLIVKGAARGVFAQPGYVLFAREGSLVAQRFDPAAGRVAEVPRVVAAIPALTDVTISSSSNETLTYAGVIAPARELSMYDRSGRRLKTVAAPLSAAVLSPDETRIAGEHRGEIWLVDLEGQRTSRVMLGPEAVATPVWSPDGGRIAFARQRAIHVRDANESARKELLADGLPSRPVLYDWSPDGRYLLYAVRTPETQWDLFVLPVAGAHTPRPLLKTPFTEYQARISTDGRWIAYVSDESGTLEVYVDAFPSLGQKTRVTTGGGMHPAWRADGRELFYLTPDQKLAVASVDSGPSFRVTGTRALFQTRITGIARNQYAVSRDGQRFLINSPISDPANSPITVVLHWPGLLQGAAMYSPAP